MHGDGVTARPGLLGHRHGGRHWAPRFTRQASQHEERLDGSRVLRHTGIDSVAGLVLTTTIEVATHGVVRMGASLYNDHARRYLLGGLSLGLPVPSHAVELLTLEGRWTDEMQMYRDPWSHGTRLVEHRGARPTSARAPVLWAMTQGAGEWHGEVWAMQLAWSGNHALVAEALPDGRRHLQAGELLHPGEICLEPHDTFTTPWVVAMWSGEGMTPASWGFHRDLRSRLPRADEERPRPVLASTWEAGYFDQNPATLRQLAQRAAQVGCERFVLDDGWFGTRRDDRRGLGDWTVSPEVHPEGLGPLFADVEAMGLATGLWVEPEMVNPDSDLYRSHPEWALTTPGYEPVTARHQLVLDLTRPEVVEYLLEHLTAVIADTGVRWLKWDMNREHLGGSMTGGAAGTHHQTLAVYHLMDELRRRFPDLEIETCASGGGRGDSAMLEHTVRVWASDCNDPVERQRIQRGWSLFLPPEVIGAHIGPPRAHTTGRRSDLGFRGLTALFGHLGVEWNLEAARPDELDDLAEIIALHRRFRSLIHHGDAVRFDTEPVVPGLQEPGVVAHGVYATDRGEALVAWMQLRPSPSGVPTPWRLPGLLSDRHYLVRQVPLPGGLPGLAARQPSWLTAPETSPVIVTGRHLAIRGLQPPVLWPERGVLVHLEAVGGECEP
jgi:alpha-galactosidase